MHIHLYICNTHGATTSSTLREEGARRKAGREGEGWREVVQKT